MAIEIVPAAAAAALHRRLLRAQWAAAGFSTHSIWRCPKTLHNHGFRRGVQSRAAMCAAFEILSGERTCPSLCFMTSRRQLSCAAASPAPISSSNSRDKADDTGYEHSASAPFVEVTDGSSHWLPSLAAALQQQGAAFSRIADAAKGNCTSADPTRAQQTAAAAAARSGWRIPRVAVVAFHAQ